MKTVAIIQARMNSTRLPGKVLLPIGDSNAIQMIVDKCKANPLINETVIATEPKSETIIQYCNDNNLNCFIGDEEDVLKRVYSAASAFGANIVIDITSDCPFIDLSGLKLYLDLIKNKKADYVSNIIERTFPDGLDLQIYTFEALSRLYNLVSEPEYYQHTGWNFTRFQDRFKCTNIYAPKELNWPELRITLDTKEDYDLICAVNSCLNEPTPINIIGFLKSNPGILKINSDIKPKIPGEL